MAAAATSGRRSAARERKAKKGHYTRFPDALPSHLATLGDGNRCRTWPPLSGSSPPSSQRASSAPDDYARFAAVLAATAFFQQLLDLTIEESLVKYGFRYVEGERWGRLRRIFELAIAFKLLGGLLAGLVLVALAPFAGSIWRRPRRVRADADRRRAGADPVAGGRRRRRADPARPVRRPRRLSGALDGRCA